MVDFSKAFDTLNFEKLYQKMEQNGIQGPMLELLKNYHTNRYNAVSIAGEQSDQIRTQYGTAQGSVLGPTEYLLYVNDMCNVFQHVSVYQFADDTCLISAHKDIIKAQSMMQEDFDTLCKWAHDLGLSINYSKTKLIYIHSPYKKAASLPMIVAHEHSCMHINNNACKCGKLEIVKEHTYLGLIIDHKFNWRSHVNLICNKLRAILSKLCVLKHKVPYRTLRLMYMSLADSVISYGLTSNGRTYKTYLNDIYNLQIRILKTIVPLKVKFKNKDNYHNLFHYCKVLSIFDKRDLAIVTQYSSDMCKLNTTKRLNTLRKLDYLPTFEIPKCHNDYGERVWNVSLARILNKLPKHIVCKLENK